MLTVRMRIIVLVALALCASLLGAGCGGQAPVGSADSGVMTSTTTGSLEFMMACTMNEECATGLCFRYNMAQVGSLCSRTCAAPADCPAPSRGCNMMGICKSP